MCCSYPIKWLDENRKLPVFLLFSYLLGVFWPFFFTFKDRLILLFCVSISSFVENSGEFAVAMVDHLLDILTKGEHSKAKQQLEEVSISVYYIANK